MLSLYLAQQTWLHRVAPAIKLGLLTLASILLLPNHSLTVLTSATLATTVLYASLGVAGRRRLVRVLKTVGLAAAMFSLFQFAFVAPDLGVGQAMELALISSLRLISLVMLADLVSITTPLADLMAVIQKLIKPLDKKGSVATKLSLAVGLLTRLAGLLGERLAQAKEAFAARGIQSPGPRLPVALMRGLNQSSVQLAQALQARNLRQVGRPRSPR